ncbi:related to ribosomal protein YmS18, mitochondrial [Cephalotrichum gorgonifer]|uniref:Related to ribosomal protein YmS18, mitochondrial n=1 Tax=Cephalotrichum gorgonifer TaxID=2041049 RepID=A0AAE8N393_9PEZI|nr:related to ribosomal protein YmS18, mitochondrial [Cephalotrichum gorgonifer]
MSTTFTRRLLAPRAIRSALESAIPSKAAPSRLVRPISTTTTTNSDDKKNLASSLFGRPSGSDNSGIGAPQRREQRPGAFAMANLSRVLGPAPPAGEEETSLASLTNELTRRGGEEEEEPYHFHVFAHKHNTHVTVTKPNRDAIISLSCGNIGFRKARRKQYDAAYQLTVYVLERLYDAGWDTKIKRMEVQMRGFGAGREAASKVLLGTEGARLKDKIVRVADATRIKFGGTKSKNPRRI